MDLQEIATAELARRGLDTSGQPLPKPEGQDAAKGPEISPQSQAAILELAKRGMSKDQIMTALTADSGKAEAPQGPDTGMARNLMGGVNRVIAGIPGAAGDIANVIARPGQWLGSAVAHMLPGGDRPLSAQDQATVDAPATAGTAAIERGLGQVPGFFRPGGIDTTQNNVATEPTSRLARATGAGAASMALPGAAFSRAATGATMLGTIGRETLAGLGTPIAETGAANALRTAGAAGIGAASGAGGAILAENVPERFKPLADAVGQLLGGGLAAGVAAGGRAGVNAGRAAIQPKINALTEAGRGQQVGMELRFAAGDEAAPFMEHMEEHGAAPEIVPGSKPTTYQTVQTPGMATFEAGARTKDYAPFEERAGQQEQARQDFLKASATGDPKAVAEHVTSTLAAIDQTAEQHIADLTAQARAANPEGRSKQDIGGDIQNHLDAANTAAKKRLDAVWQNWRDQRGPDGEPIRFDVSAVRSHAGELLRPGEGAEPPTGREAALYQRAQMLGNVASSEAAQNIRQTAGELERQAVVAGDAATVRRLKLFKRTIDQSIADAVARGEGAAPAGSAKAPAEPAAPAAGNTVYSPSGRPVGVRYEVVEGSTLKPASGDLQPRDRNRQASDAQISDIRQKLQPERLGPAPGPETGAPIVGPDHVIEAGNGRYAGIMQAHFDGGASSKAYRDYLTSLGYDVSGHKMPVLIRRRTSDMTPEERVQWAQETNKPAGMAPSHAEQAAQDAGRLSHDVFDRWNGGELMDAGNADFRTAAARKVFDKTEINGVTTRDGELNLEGQRRLSAALTHHAYDDPRLLSHFTEEGETGLNAMGKALETAAPEAAALKSAIKAGKIGPEYDLAPAVSDAVRILGDARRRGVTLQHALGQQDMFAGNGVMGADMLRLAYGDALKGRMSADRLGDALKMYAKEARNQTGGPSLFGETPRTLPRDIIEQARAKYGRAGESGKAAGGAAAAGEGLRAGGAEARGPGDGAAGAQAPAGPAARDAEPATAAAEAIAPPEPQPAPAPEPAPAPTPRENMTREAAEAYKAAKAATVAKKQTFEESQVGAAIRRDNSATGFRETPEQVANRFWNSGVKGREAVQDYFRAGGNPDLLKEAAARSLHDYATIPEGKTGAGGLDPDKTRAWMGKHGDKLLQVPELARQFSSAAGRTEAVQAVAKEAARTRKDFETGAARYFLKGQDPADAVKRMLDSNTPEKHAAEMARLTSGHPEARAGLQRATVDHILENLRSNRLIPGTHTTELAGNAVKTFIRDKAKALSWYMTKDQIHALEMVAEDQLRSDLSTTNKPRGGPGTAAHLHAAGGTGDGKQSVLQSLSGPAVVFGGLTLLHSVGTGAVGALASHLYHEAAKGHEAALNALRTEAALNPELAYDLMRKVKPGTQESGLAMRQLNRTLLKLGLYAPARAMASR
jgi:hypothetical protein